MKKPHALKGRPSPLRGKGKAYQWLREHVGYRGTNCLKWPFSVNKTTGYAQCGINGKMTYAHRWMCEQRNGPAPSPAHEAAHTCGNGHMACVNPNHLIWKTHQQNAQDRLRHGNYSNRLGQRRFKLTAEAADQILALKGRKTQFELAEMFGVSRCTISSVHCGRVWADNRVKFRLFTEDEAVAIRARWPAVSIQALAAEYDVKYMVMWRLCTGKTYPVSHAA